MHKKISFAIIILFTLFVFSCNNNNNDGNQPAAAADKETQMKNLIAQYPDSLLLKENLIQYYRDNNQYDKALATTNEALKKDSLNARFWNIQATLYFENADTLDAITSFEKAISIVPDPQYIMSLGGIFAQTKNPLAITMADLLVKNPTSDMQKESLFIKGLYYRNTGDYTKAISYLTNCISIDYTYTIAYREKAICLYNMGNYKAALDVLTKATEVVNTYDEGYYWMGRCYEKLNDKEDAVKSYELALQINKDYTDAQDALTRLGVQQ